MIPGAWLQGEVAVVGLGRSGRGAATLLARAGARIYASDSSSNDDVGNVAADLAAIGVQCDTGRHDLDRIRRAALLVVSPGIPPDSPPIRAGIEAAVPIRSEVEIALLHLPHTSIIAVTGTNGKTTTTALTGHLLRSMGYVAIDGGNIGTPLSEIAMLDSPPTWVALEMSSFQLHDTPSIDPTVGVLTNLGPDHLDRYANIEEYYADKALLFRNARADSNWVSNLDDPDSLRLAEVVPGAMHRFSLERQEADAWFNRVGNTLIVRGKTMIARSELALLGDHNVANALAASLAVVVADPVHESTEMHARMADGLRTFRGLPHRLEIVAERSRLMWINDSKATNVSSALMAVRSMMRPTVLLLGGKHKGEPYTALAPDIAAHCRLVIAYGAAASIIENDLSGLVPVLRMGSSFEDVIRAARQAAEPGDAVLLSPACSSYDMFNNYEERGDLFRSLAISEGEQVE
jgi:UDP-N-acetylmuramoylalanine--D-glutamate ligase